MGYSLTGSVITQTGTDTNLSGLTSITGVTSLSFGTGDQAFTVYDIGDKRINIQGTQTITATKEMLAVNNTTNGFGLFVSSTGDLTIDGTLSYTNGDTDSQAEGFRAYRQANNGGGGTIMGIKGDPNSTITIENARITTGSLARFEGNATFTNATVTLSDLTPGSGQQFQLLTASGNGTISIDGLKVGGFAASINGAVDNVTGFSPQNTAVGISYQSSSDAMATRFHKFIDYNPINVTSEVGQYGNNGDKGTMLINSVKGSATTFNRTNSVGGMTEIRKRFQITVSDTSGTAIQGAIYFIRDTDNGNRVNRSGTGWSINYVNDRTYDGTTDVNGQAGESGDAVLVAAKFDLTTIDRRSKSNDANDQFDIPVWSYGHVNFTAADQSFRGAGDLEVGITLLDDLNIDQSTRATVDAYTVLSDLGRVYDRAKSFKVNVSNIEFPAIDQQIFNASGESLVMNVDNLVIGSSGSAFSVNTGTSTVTINAGTLATGGPFTTLNVLSGQDASITGTASLSANLNVASGGDFTLDDIDDLTGTLTLAGTLTIQDNTGGAGDLPSGTVASTGRIVFSDSIDATIDAQNLVFDSSSTIENTGGSDLTIVFTPGQTRPTKVETSGTITFVNEPVPISITVIDATGTAIQGARVFLEETVSGTDLINELTDVNGQVTTTFAYDASDVAVTGRVRRGTSTPRYKTADIVGTITTSGFSTTVLMVLDE